MPKGKAAAPARAVQTPVSEPKGRPFLQWVGKKPLDRVTAFPAQLVERFDPAGEAEAGAAPNLLLHGDNKDVLAWLLVNGYRGKVDLVYIDPPFDSGADYVRRVGLRGLKGSTRIEGEAYTLGEQTQYTDIWANDNYLQFMYERLLLLKELLAEHGSLYLHSDPSRNSYLRVVLDEVFGAGALVNEIVWQRLSAHNDSTRYGIIHDTVYYYAKSDERRWTPQAVPLNQRYIDQFFDSVEETTGRRYSRSDLTARGLRSGETGKVWRGINPGAKGNHWKVTVAQLDEWDREGRIHWPASSGMPRLKRYLDEVQANGASPQDVWYDVRPIHNQSQELGEYPTQKPETLLDRIIRTSSDPGDVVLDCFIGSGTTAAVAQKLGRRWIGCDINKGAIQTTSKRLQAIIAGQVAAGEANGGQEKLLEEGAPNATPEPAALSFAVYRVNDYDLQIQHNEAVEMVCEHVGVQRTRTDAFFDGVQGDRLVKIVPLNHPCTLLDLQLIADEIGRRGDDPRDVLVIALGKETTVEGWIADWNARQPIAQAGPVRSTRINQIRLIELRTDKQYGKFFAHKPASAVARLERRGKEIAITVEDFVSPTILERLQNDQGVLSVKISEWRSMVDCVLIDTDYDGEVFNIRLSDVPEKKTDLVQGSYVLPAPRKGAKIAVKLIDMLGEEVLVVLDPLP